MNWFTRWCRKSGLLINRTIQGKLGSAAQTLHHQQFTQENRVAANVTVRRTTIEEIQIHDQPTGQERLVGKLEPDRPQRSQGAN